ncbi:MAG: hypothetical protein NTY81_03860 [Candidatus Staskawiczbacteria bacterium]|nr:hypothetical protein [Candidatus Staskawiczbacteria bacterium]
MGITIVFLLFLTIVSLGVFLSEPKEVSSSLVFNKPKVNVDMGIFDSEQFKNLQTFSPMQTQYTYTASTSDRQIETGFISAVSKEEAQKILQDMGLTVSKLEEVQIGRDNPFIPYYQ